SAIAANTGTSRAAEAVLLVNSVRKIIKVATTKIIISGEASPKALARVCPSTSELPESFRMALKVRPPPNRYKTPQSVFSAICFQLAVPRITTIQAAEIAIQVSGWEIPKISVNFLLKIQAIAVQIKRIMVAIRVPVQGIFSVTNCTL